MRLPLALVFLVGASVWNCGPTSTEPTDPDAGVPCPDCAGCCVDGVCKVGSARSACGSAGALCDVCSAGESCHGGSCALTCDDSTCPSGCCQDGACMGGTAATACGGGGGTCASCGSAGVCRSRTCVAAAVVSIQWIDTTSPPSGYCPAIRECTYQQTMSVAEYNALVSANYGACLATSTNGGMGRLIDCKPDWGPGGDGTCREACGPSACCSLCDTPKCTRSEAGSCSCSWP